MAKLQEQRLSREEWLSQALDILTREGNAKLRVDAICKALGVTKGSFYWHFRDRMDFLRSLIEYWSTAFTTVAIERLRRLEGDARDRLLGLMKLLHEVGYPRHDLSVRALAAQEPELAELVRRTDRQRLAFVRSLFAEMGFSGAELEMRTRLFVVYQSLELGFFDNVSEERYQEMMKRRHALLTRP